MKPSWHRLIRLAVTALPAILSAPAQTDRYVVQGNPGQAAPFTNWAAAAATIQDAVDAAAPGDTIWVTNGIFAEGGRPAGGGLLTNRLVVDKAVWVRNAGEDPAQVVIVGAWDPLATNGDAAVRCVYLASGAGLIGLTLTNGASRAAAGADGQAGGAWCADATVTLSNCVIVECAGDLQAAAVYRGTLRRCTIARTYGGARAVDSATLQDCDIIGRLPDGFYDGGVSGSTLSGCRLTGCYAKYGGAASGSTLSNCVVAGNRGGTSGGGVYACTLYDCVVSNNTSRGGGGAQGSTLVRCTVVNNAATDAATSYSGGGAAASRLVLCTVADNTSPYGGGLRGGSAENCVFRNNRATSRDGGAAYAAALYNSLLISNRADGAGPLYGYGGGSSLSTQTTCTVVANQAATDGGGLHGGAAFSSIIWGNNAAGAGTNHAGDPVFLSSCSAPEPAGGWHASNVSTDPRFAAAAAGNYRLGAGSPCKNAGLNESWMTDPADERSRDLDGNPRIARESVAVVDMGAYEHIRQSGTVLTFR